jgi:DNA-binding beta-propeller fold protein YncE
VITTSQENEFRPTETFPMKAVSILALVAVCSFVSATGQEKNPVELSKTIRLPEVQGGFNHMSVDAGHQRLFVTATTKKALEIIDLQSGKPWRSLLGDSPAAALFAPKFNQLYVTRGHSVCIYDGSTFELVASVPLDSSLDELQYDPNGKRLYVGCMTSNKTAIAVIGIPDGKPKGRMNLPAKPQGFIVEQKGSRIFANTPGLQQIALLDREKQTVLSPWSLKDAAANYPIALDEANHRLFVGCRRPAQLVVLDTATGRQVASVLISADTDDLSFDPLHKRILAACGNGFLDIIQQRDADTYHAFPPIPTREGARNSCFSADRSEFYLAVPARGGQPAEIRVYQSR